MALVMYDLDGTLLDTAGEIAQAVNLTLEEFNHGSSAKTMFAAG